MPIAQWIYNILSYAIYFSVFVATIFTPSISTCDRRMEYSSYNSFIQQNAFSQFKLLPIFCIGTRPLIVNKF